MRVVALLALMWGFIAQMLLDGQTYSHAWEGIVCGVVAMACGVGLVRKDRANRWEGRIVAILGLALGLWSVIVLPSAYRFQQRFNARTVQRLAELRTTMDTNVVARLVGQPTEQRATTNSDGQAYKVWIYPIGPCLEASIYFTPDGHYHSHRLIGG